VPQVFLSNCFGATPGAEAGAMATELVRAGVPFVVAMQAGVTDFYASALAHALYAAPEREDPQPAQALASARQALEQARQQALQLGAPADQTQAEFATATLYCTGDEAPLVDFAVPREPLSAPPVHQAVGPMPICASATSSAAAASCAKCCATNPPAPPCEAGSAAWSSSASAASGAP
jgi:hypothetical protein